MLPAYDGNGNLVALVNAADGTLAAEYDYGPFGELLRATGPMAKANPFRFSTKYQDDESDLVRYEPARYYSPASGRWLSRDPLDELGFFTLSDNELGDGDSTGSGENPYLFVGDAPIGQVDLLGLALYAVDGTWKDASRRANPWQLWNNTKESPRRYWPGPKNGPTGKDSWEIALRVYNQIEADFCAARQAGTPLTVNLTGWSRGAMIAARVASMLNDLGCWCWECGEWEHHHPVQVNWVGLFDACSMMKDPGNWPSAVPGNVAHFDHAIKTKKQTWLPTWHFTGSTEKAFTNNDGSQTSHNDIGMSVIKGNINGVYPWIKDQAVAAGVKF